MNGISRLANMIKGQKDKYLIKIVEHLLLQTEMDQDFLKEEKNLKDMAEYIKDLARKQATNGVAVIEDDEVYRWAENYFKKSNEELGIKKTKSTEKKVEKVVENNKDNDEFGSIFGSIFDSAPVEQEKKKEEIEQISLFGM